MRLALNVLTAMVITFSYGTVAGTIGRYYWDSTQPEWVVTEVYDGD